jgi:hypothetical protein
MLPPPTISYENVSLLRASKIHAGTWTSSPKRVQSWQVAFYPDGGWRAISMPSYGKWPSLKADKRSEKPEAPRRMQCRREMTERSGDRTIGLATTPTFTPTQHD